MNDENRPQLGQIVKVMRGRELGKYSVIVSTGADRFVWIADGDKRKFDQPKKKNLLHLQLQDVVSREVAESLKETGRVTNGKLRFALAKFLESVPNEDEQKGE